MSVSLVLLNDTLRWHDNPLLAFANASPSPQQKKVALVVLDKAAFFGRQYGLQRANLHRLQQHIDLGAELAQLAWPRDKQSNRHRHKLPQLLALAI